jgi:hypothetical protein
MGFIGWFFKNGLADSNSQKQVPATMETMFKTKGKAGILRSLATIICGDS